jgi:Sec-independent protein translocase protein TatA
MMSRRRLLVLMGASVILLGANATPVQAPVLGGNMKKFRDRQAAKKRANKEKIEKKKKEEQKEENKSDE